MVVLAASIVTKEGNVLVSRQFQDMERSRIEVLLKSFPKLIIPGQQHTTVETEDVRYVYRLWDDLLIVLVTNLRSNILQDVESIDLFAKIVTKICDSPDESTVFDKAFELLSAFDEIISEGVKEKLSAGNIMTNLTMYSEEEKIHEAIRKSKAEEAREEAKKREKEIERKIREEKEAEKRRAQFGNSYMRVDQRNDMEGRFFAQEQRARTPEIDYTRPSAPISSSKPKGMKLGGKKKSTLAELDDLPPPPQSRPAPISPVAKTPPPQYQERVHVSIEEKNTLTLVREGDMDKLEKMEIKGVLKMNITDKELLDDICLVMKKPDDSNVKFKTHPKVDKDKFDNDILQKKPNSKPFPPYQDLDLLKWSFTTADETVMPLSVSCWPTTNGNPLEVTIEYELQHQDVELYDVVISVPLVDDVEVTTSDDYDGCKTEITKDNTYAFVWRIPVINSENNSGMIECEIPLDDPESLFPVTIDFKCKKPLTGTDVDTAMSIGTGESVEFVKEFK